MVRGRGVVATLTQGRGALRLPEWSAADAEADETGDGAAGLLHDLADRLLRVLREALVQQHVLLVEAVQAALDDLGQGLLGLALVLEIGRASCRGSGARWGGVGRGTM